MASKDWKAEAQELRKQVTSLQKTLQNGKIQFDDENHAIEVHQTISLHPNTYQYLKDRKSEASEILQRAVNMGLLAAQQARIHNALSSFNTSLSGEYALLQQHMSVLDERLKSDNKHKTEVEFVLRDALQKFADIQNFPDIFTLSGTSADSDSGNKTGDVEATIKTSAASYTIAIESKMAQTYQKGDNRKTNQDKLRADGDTAISQMIESRKNRVAEVCLFVIDEMLNPFPGPAIEFFPEPIVSFIVRVNVAEGDFTNLHHAYSIARAMALSQRKVTDPEISTIQFFLENIIQSLKRQKFIKEIGKRTMNTIKTSQDTLLKNVEEDLTKFDAELFALTESLSQMQTSLEKFLSDGTISPTDALEIYQLSDAKKLYEAKKLEWKIDDATDQS